MDSAQVREYLVDYGKKEFPLLVERDLVLDKSNKIKAIIGPRRAGKTFFLFQTMRKLLDEGDSRDSILYLNFEDPRLSDLTYKEIRNVVELHWQLYPSSIKKKMHLFIDEPQNVDSWEKAVRGLYDDGMDIYITGSSSKLLSKEIATSMRGRSLSYILLPLSFAEFLKIKNRAFDPDRLGSKDKAFLLSLLEEYLEYGGFPEVAIEENVEVKLKILEDYVTLTTYKDLVERFKIKNTHAVKWLMKSAAQSFSREFSIHKTFNTMKSRGIKVSKNTLYSYVSMLEDSFYLFTLPKKETSERKRDFSINKVYLCDTGYAKIQGAGQDTGYRMENAVFLQLLRNKKTLTQISYWKNNEQEEADYVITEEGKTTRLIQVCYDAQREETIEREEKALLKASYELGCNTLEIITWDTEKNETRQYNNTKKSIRYVPLWKWLLRT
jgi:uncharacterized protein